MGTCTTGGCFDDSTHLVVPPVAPPPRVEPVEAPAPPPARRVDGWSSDALDATLTQMVADMVTTHGQEAPMGRKPELDAATVERLRALKADAARVTVNRDDLRAALREARAEKREAGREDRPAARLAVQEIREELREAKVEQREAKDALVDFERAHGLREGSVRDLLEGMVEGAVAKAVAALLDHLATLEGRLVEALPGLVSGAVSSAVGAIDFGKALPGPVGTALEAHDDQVLEVLSEVVAETFDADGLTLDELADIAARRLGALGVSITRSAVLGRVQAFLE